MLGPAGAAAGEGEANKGPWRHIPRREQNTSVGRIGDASLGGSDLPLRFTIRVKDAEDGVTFGQRRVDPAGTHPGNVHGRQAAPATHGGGACAQALGLLNDSGMMPVAIPAAHMIGGLRISTVAARPVGPTPRGPGPDGLGAIQWGAGGGGGQQVTPAPGKAGLVRPRTPRVTPRIPSPQCVTG